jgi:predicted alpha/beta hydrolase family esterase
MQTNSKNQVKIIFIHGNGGGDINAPDGWFPYLKRELDQHGLNVISQNFPDPVYARKKYWLPFLEKLGADEKSILIGHSSGAVAAMRYAEEHKLLGTILVSACYTDLGMPSERISGYYDEEWQWEKIKSNQKWIVQFHSTDDPLIPVEEARYVHQKLGSEYIEDTNEQHYGYPVAKPEFPEIITIIRQKLQI